MPWKRKELQLLQICFFPPCAVSIIEKTEKKCSFLFYVQFSESKWKIFRLQERGVVLFGTGLFGLWPCWGRFHPSGPRSPGLGSHGDFSARLVGLPGLRAAPFQFWFHLIAPSGFIIYSLDNYGLVGPLRAVGSVLHSFSCIFMFFFRPWYRGIALLLPCIYDVFTITCFP